jgi:hypothetical protein
MRRADAQFARVIAPGFQRARPRDCAAAVINVATGIALLELELVSNSNLSTLNWRLDEMQLAVTDDVPIGWIVHQSRMSNPRSPRRIRRHYCLESSD